MLVLPFVLIAHAVLIVRARPRFSQTIYAVIHMIVFIPIWIASLMLISKDSL
jgi:hypothetical protein